MSKRIRCCDCGAELVISLCSSCWNKVPYAVLIERSRAHDEGRALNCVHHDNIKPGDRVRIREGYCGAGYRFTVEKLYDNRGSTVDPCIQVYGTNHGPVRRLSEVEKV